MKQHTKITFNITLALTALSALLWGCTKIQEGFLSPYMQYPINKFSFVRGRDAASDALTTDGSDVPLNAKVLHYYDANGKIVDDLFTTEYPVGVWTAMYNPQTDKTYEAIMAKRSTENLPPIVVNETNGVVYANSASRYLPLGEYTIDLQVSNAAGTQVLEKILTLEVKDGKDVEIVPETGAFSNSLLAAGTGSGVGALAGPNNGVFFNGQNNPFVRYELTRLADTPNMFTLKVTDRNGVPFSPLAGEFAKRPASGLNPDPPFLQNLEGYAPDTYVATDSAITIRFPLVPFPLASLGNGYNMYYVIRSRYVTIDSTTSWGSNTEGNYYKGAADPHYLGEYTNDRFDYSIRVPMRIFSSGKYQLSVKVLNTTHR